MSKTDTEDKDTHETEVAVSSFANSEFVKGLLEAFEEALQAANELSKASHEETKRDDAKRIAALKSLEAVLQLIEALYPKNHRNLNGPILETYEALLGAQIGAAPSSLLMPKPTGGSPTTRPEIELLQGEAAAAMELLIRAEDTKDKAARKVARRVGTFDLESLGYTRKHRTGITATTIKGWRDKFTGTGDGSLGAMRYKNVLDSLEGEDPEAAAVVALKFVLGSMLPKNRENPPS